MDIKLPSGLVIKNVPEGTSPEQVKSEAIASGMATAADFGDTEHDFSAVEMVKNVPSSAQELLSDMYQTLRHPVQTAKGVGNVLTGAAQKASGALGYEGLGEGKEQYADAAWDAIKDRYGSVDAFQRSLETDPVGVVADIAGLVGGAGLATKSSALAKAGAAANPINLALNAPKAIAAKAVPSSWPVSMYEDVAKFSTTLPIEQRKSMVDTALEHQIKPTAKGAEKLSGMIGQLNQQLDSLISQASQSGATIPKSAVYKHLADLRKEKGGVRLDAPRDLDVINKVIGKFNRHLDAIGKDQLTASDLQGLKVAAYGKVSYDAKKGKGSLIKEDTYKAVARGAKEGVEELVPEAGDINRQLGSLYELQPSLLRSANRIDQRNMIPIDATMQTGLGTMIGGPVGAGVGATSALLGLPSVKSGLALKLHKMKQDGSLKQLIQNNPNISMAELTAIMAGRTPTESDLQGEQQPYKLLGR